MEEKREGFWTGGKEMFCRVVADTKLFRFRVAFVRRAWLMKRNSCSAALVLLCVPGVDHIEPIALHKVVV